MDEHNRCDYKGLGARKNTHAGSLRILFPVPRVRSSVLSLPSRFSTCDEGSKKKGDDTFAFFCFIVRIPKICPKILTVRELFGARRCQDTRKSPGILAEKQQLRASTATWSNLFRRVYARHNLARVVKFRPPPRKEAIARGKIQTMSRISRIVDIFFSFSRRMSVRFYAKPNIACIWNSEVTHLRCRNEKSYLKVRGNSWKFVHAVPPE